MAAHSHNPPKRKYLVVYQDMSGNILSQTIKATSRDQANAIVRARGVIYVYGARPPKNGNGVRVNVRHLD